MHRIEVEIEEVGVAVVVAAGQPARDERRLAVVHPRGDVHRLVVVGNSNFGPLGRRLAFVGILLREVGGCGDALPRFVVEAAIDDRCARDTDGRDGGAGGVCGNALRAG